MLVLLLVIVEDEVKVMAVEGGAEDVVVGSTFSRVSLE